MRKQLLINGSLLVLALGTLGVVWATRDVPTTGEQLARKDQLFPEFTADLVSAVKLSKGAEVLELGRSAGEFRIVKPWPERADIATMSKWLGAADLALVERPADGVSDERAGFGPSAWRASLEMGKKTLKLTIGGPAPTPEGARYAKVEDAGSTRTYVVRGSVASELDIPFDTFRETRLLEYGVRELAKIHLESAAGAVDLEQREHGAFFLHVGAGWELTRPRALRAITERLSRLSSEQFVDAEQARALLGASPVRLKLELKDTAIAPVSITLGGSCPKDSQLHLLLREQAGRSPRAACVSPELSAGLTIETESLRLRGPVAAETDEIEELTITRAGQRLDMARKDKAFVLRAPTSSEVPLDIGNQRISAILSAEGELSNADLGASDGELIVQIAGGDEAAHREERVLLGKPHADGGSCFKRLTDNVTRCVPRALAQDLIADASLLRGLSLLSFAPSELSSLRLESAAVSQRLVRHADGSYQLEEPKGFTYDAASVTELVRDLGTLEALRWVATAAQPSFGLSHPAVRARIQLSAGSERELVVGDKQPGGARYATLSPDPAVFSLSEDLYASLTEPLIDHGLCPFADTELERIDLRRGAGESRTVDGPLREALSALRAGGVAHLGPARPGEGFEAPKLTLTFVASGGKTSRVAIGRCDPAPAERCYARRDQVDATFLLQSDIAKSLRDAIQE